ncbi:hypothetical protein CIB48_g1051 [Xylaria polymorpha]|nr:hypothetical protein CIB48_g1051 [Xylaria polymorpha]
MADMRSALAYHCGPLFSALRRTVAARPILTNEDEVSAHPARMLPVNDHNDLSEGPGFQAPVPIRYDARRRTGYSNQWFIIHVANSTDWTYYHNLQVLKSCGSPILFETNLYNAIDDPNSHLSLRACTASPGNLESRALFRGKNGITNFPRTPAVETLAWGETASSIDGTSIASALVPLQ